MRIVAFAGPSLSSADRSAWPQVEWRPPAEAGDLLRLLPSLPERVCLIDGYFDHRPAVRHKEILWLLARGIAVYGAASMGALRAAEMAPFGMVGVGAIYRAYRRGTLVGDDEVALAHATAEHGWRQLSLPLVNVRATLICALRERILSLDDARAIIAAAKADHYVDRCWRSAMAGAGHGFDRVNEWLGSGAIDLKRLDASVCMAKATGLEMGQSHHRPQPIRTAHLEELARDCSVDLD